MDDRTRKANKISAILYDFCDGELEKYRCLDFGCSSGVISAYLATQLNLVIGIDVEIDALRIAQDHKLQKFISPYYVYGNGDHLPFNDGMFDIVICAQVYEHVIDPKEIVGEISRVLKPGGFCFFSGPNRLAVIEEHYWLPFLSWLPHKIASIYMRIMKRGNVYDIYPLTYWQLIHLWEGYKIIDYSVKLFRQPERFSVEERVENFRYIRHFPNWLLNAFRPYYPNFNWILVKTS